MVKNPHYKDLVARSTALSGAVMCARTLGNKLGAVVKATGATPARAVDGAVLSDAVAASTFEFETAIITNVLFNAKVNIRRPPAPKQLVAAQDRWPHVIPTPTSHDF